MARLLSWHWNRFFGKFVQLNGRGAYIGPKWWTKRFDCRCNNDSNNNINWIHVTRNKIMLKRFFATDKNVSMRSKSKIVDDNIGVVLRRPRQQRHHQALTQTRFMHSFLFCLGFCYFAWNDEWNILFDSTDKRIFSGDHKRLFYSLIQNKKKNKHK